MTKLVVLCTLFVGGAAWFYVFITAPERVYGSKVLDCSPFEITWSANGSTTMISGCGKTTEAVCFEERCDARDEPSGF